MTMMLRRTLLLAHTQIFLLRFTVFEVTDSVRYSQRYNWLAAYAVWSTGGGVIERQIGPILCTASRVQCSLLWVSLT